MIKYMIHMNNMAICNEQAKFWKKFQLPWFYYILCSLAAAFKPLSLGSSREHLGLRTSSTDQQISKHLWYVRI